MWNLPIWVFLQLINFQFTLGLGESEASQGCFTSLQPPSQVPVVTGLFSPWRSSHLVTISPWTSAALWVNTIQSLEPNFYCSPDSSLLSCLFSCLISGGKNGLLWLLPIYSLYGEKKNPSVSSCSIYIWNTQPYLSLANSFFSVKSFCLKHYLFFLHQRDHLFQPLHSALHSSAFQQQEALVPMQNLFYPLFMIFFHPANAVPAVWSSCAVFTPTCSSFCFYSMSPFHSTAVSVLNVFPGFLAAILYTTSLWVSASL